MLHYLQDTTPEQDPLGDFLKDPTKLGKDWKNSFLGMKKG
jgi:hypothetical protein